MPLIDRQLTQSIPALSLPRVKLEAPSFLDSSSSEEGREGPDGKWSVEENLRFVIFVHYYQEIFSSRHRRRYSAHDPGPPRSSKPSTNTYRIGQLPSAVATTKRSSRSLRPSPNSEGTSNSSTDATTINASSRTSRIYGKLLTLP